MSKQPRLMARVLLALEEQFERDLQILKDWSDENGPYIELSTAEQLRRYQDPIQRDAIIRSMMQGKDALTTGEQAVRDYISRMETAAMKERKRMMEG